MPCAGIMFPRLRGGRWRAFAALQSHAAVLPEHRARRHRDLVPRLSRRHRDRARGVLAWGSCRRWRAMKAPWNEQAVGGGGRWFGLVQDQPGDGAQLRLRGDLGHGAAGRGGQCELRLADLGHDGVARWAWCPRERAAWPPTGGRCIPARPPSAKKMRAWVSQQPYCRRHADRRGWQAPPRRLRPDGFPQVFLAMAARRGQPALALPEGGSRMTRFGAVVWFGVVGGFFFGRGGAGPAGRGAQDAVPDRRPVAPLSAISAQMQLVIPDIGQEAGWPAPHAGAAPGRGSGDAQPFCPPNAACARACADTWAMRGSGGKIIPHGSRWTAATMNAAAQSRRTPRSTWCRATSARGAPATGRPTAGSAPPSGPGSSRRWPGMKAPMIRGPWAAAGNGSDWCRSHPHRALAQLRGRDRAKPCSTAWPNLRCGIRIMAVTVPRDGVVAEGMRGVAADWGPFHSTRKREEMRSWVSRQDYCQARTRPLDAARGAGRGGQTPVAAGGPARACAGAAATLAGGRGGDAAALSGGSAAAHRHAVIGRGADQSQRMLPVVDRDRHFLAIAQHQHGPRQRRARGRSAGGRSPRTARPSSPSSASTVQRRAFHPQPVRAGSPPSGRS